MLQHQQHPAHASPGLSLFPSALEGVQPHHPRGLICHMPTGSLSARWCLEHGLHCKVLKCGGVMGKEVHSYRRVTTVTITLSVATRAWPWVENQWLGGPGIQQVWFCCSGTHTEEQMQRLPKSLPGSLVCVVYSVSGMPMWSLQTLSGGQEKQMSLILPRCSGRLGSILWQSCINQSEMMARPVPEASTTWLCSVCPRRTSVLLVTLRQLTSCGP